MKLYSQHRHLTPKVCCLHLNAHIAYISECQWSISPGWWTSTVWYKFVVHNVQVWIRDQCINNIGQVSPKEDLTTEIEIFYHSFTIVFCVFLLCQSTFQLMGSRSLRPEEGCDSKSWCICLIRARAMKQADIKLPFFLPSIFTW